VDAIKVLDEGQGPDDGQIETPNGVQEEEGDKVFVIFLPNTLSNPA